MQDSDDPQAGLPVSETVPQDRPAPDRERIAQRAYERFQGRGGEHGRDQDDWFEAERDLAERPPE